MTEPRISVVVATRDRAESLAVLLSALEQQTLASTEFEVVVVDDGSTDQTPVMLRESQQKRALPLQVLSPVAPGSGPAAARNAGWRAARGAVIAFTDDDCRPTEEWLERGLEAFVDGSPRVVQGRVEKDPELMHLLGPFAHWIEVHDAGQGFPTANIFYTRELLERIGGFDETFPRAAGEDTDLGWRAVEAGAVVSFAADALVYHAIVALGPVERLRINARWTDAVRNYRLHPQIPKVKGLFWRYNHWELFRFGLALALPRWMGPVRLFLAAPYVKHLTNRRTGPLLSPYLLALDVAEVLAVVRGAIRYRVFVL